MPQAGPRSPAAFPFPFSPFFSLFPFFFLSSFFTLYIVTLLFYTPRHALSLPRHLPTRPLGRTQRSARRSRRLPQPAQTRRAPRWYSRRNLRLLVPPPSRLRLCCTQLHAPRRQG